MAARVPPVDISSTPRSLSARAMSTRPVLSKTEISARLGVARSAAAGAESGALAKAISFESRGKAQASGGRRLLALPGGRPP
jgi:hypothetical protein